MIRIKNFGIEHFNRIRNHCQNDKKISFQHSQDIAKPAVEEGRKFTVACSRLEQDLTQLTTRSTEVHSRMEGAKEAIAALRQKKETLEQTLNLKREDLSFKRSRLTSRSRRC